MNVKNLKKGFTLTELIIVIVIIGILVGILVPTFVSVIRKANKSADLSLVRNLNDSLALDGIENGRHNNMSEAVEAAKQYGFDIEKINSKVSKNAILWDSKNDVFCYLDEDNIEYYPDSIPKKDQLEAGDYNLWIISDKPHASYSTYYIGNKESETVRNVGFDAGNSEIKDIKYVGTKGNSVVIRTNGGTLTINAASDTVNHYGEGLVLDIQAIAGSSYHEFGHFLKATIKQGRLVVEDTGSVSTIVVEAASASDVSVDISKVSVEDAPVVYAENETVAAELNTIVEASQEVKDSSIQTAVFTKHVTTPAELKTALLENGYVIVDNDMEFSSPLWISATDGSASNVDHAVTLDLNGKTLSTTSSFVGRPLMNCVKLTVTGNGTITSVNSKDGNGAIRNFNELVIENGTFLGSPLGGGSAIDNQAYAKVTINDGYFGGTGGLNNRDNGIAVVNGGRFITEACSALPGEVYCYALRSSGKITINNAYVRGAHGAVAIIGGNAVINNVDSETYVCSTAEGQIADHSSHGDKTYYALYVAGEQTNVSCVVNGGHFKASSKSAVYIGNNTPGDGGNRQKAFVTISGGEFSTAGSASIITIDGTLGFAYLYGGKYSNNNVKIGSTSTYHLDDICDQQMSSSQEGNWYVVK